jgi:serine/threonine protein phosphatase 1
LDEPWFRAIRGNHEQLLLDAAWNEDSWLEWTTNGGDWAWDYPWDDPDLRARLESLPWAADLTTGVGRIGLVHADLDRSDDWRKFLKAIEADRGSARQAALWSRRSAHLALRGQPGRRVRGADLVLVGHSIMERSFQWGNIWFLDSGAVISDAPDAALSMLEVHPKLKSWSLSTANDPVTALWWSQQTNRLTEAMARRR